MVCRLTLAILFILELDTLVNATKACIDEMTSCTKQMTSDIKAMDNRSMICGIMGVYLNCIQYSCNTSLNECQMNNARSRVTKLLKDYGLHCGLHVPPTEEYCSASLSIQSTSYILVLCVTLYVCIFYTLNTRRQ